MEELAAGADFSGYVIEGVAGRGGMGVVYRARQLRPARQVALKLVAVEHDDPQARRRFEREAELAASIEHPHIIPVYEVGEYEGRLFIAMRFVTGTDLAAAIRRDGPLAPDLAVTILHQVAQALDAAHGAGLVHRDVKPANVLLSGDVAHPHAYLTDFGLGRSTESPSLTHSSDFVGTLDYVAPEMLLGDQVGPRADVYALGCVLYEMLVGRPPFSGDSAAAKVFAHLHHPPPAPSAASAALATFDAAVRRGMAKAAHARPATAGDLAFAAEAALVGTERAHEGTVVVPRAALAEPGGHVVITGLTPAASRLARSFAAAGQTVIEAGAVDEPRPEVLAGWDLAAARHLIVTGGDPIANLGVARAAEEAVRERSGTLGALVQCEHLDLWRTLQTEAVSRIEHPHIRVDFFSVLAVGAELILERQPPLAAAAPHPCVVGAGGLAEALVLGIARRHRLEAAGEEPLPVTLTGPEADVLAEDLLDRFPELAELCDLRVRPAELRSAALRRGEVLFADRDRPVSVVYMALDDPAATLTVAAGLARPRGGGPEVPVVASLVAAESGPGSLFGGTAGPLGRVILFDVAAEVLTPELVIGASTEVLARAKHAQYLDAERRRGAADPDDPSLTAWEELPKPLKDSNRRFADGVGRKLRSSGLRLAPSPLLSLDEGLLTFTPEEVEALAQEEHDRWVRDLERDGWQRTDGARDPHRRLHPQLVPWEELTEDVREKDREPVRELPRMLGRLGYELYRADG